jgi:hypothetical protein
MARKKKSDIISEENLQQPEYMEPMREISFEQVSRNWVQLFGSYVNNFRALPDIISGLKRSYTRLIYTASLFKSGELIPSNALIGKMSEVHPHGLTGVEGTLAEFVKAGIFTGDGCFGSKNIDGTEDTWAAPRYTKSCISDKWSKIIGGTIKEVNYSMSPAGHIEPDYIPTPLPICFLMKSVVSGMGLGASTLIPLFNAQSMLNAFLNNNPLLLESGINLNLDKEKSELYKLWTTGVGKVCYYYNLQRVVAPDGRDGVLISGDTGVFTPNLKKLRKLEDEGKITIEDQTDQNGPKLFISKIPGARNITADEIEKECKRVCYNSTKYQLYVSDTKSAFLVPLKNWIEYTYNNYITLITQVNQKRIGQVEFEISVQEALPIVVDYVLNKNPKAENSELSKNLGIPIGIIESVMSKPISHLRKTKDTTERVKALKKRLSELKKFDPVKHTFEIIQEM